MKSPHYNTIARHSFASDNNSGVHPSVFQAMLDANAGHVIAYGDDPFTTRAVMALRKHFGESAEVFFFLTGTGANIASLAAMTRPYEAVICAETAHINVDECGAPEHVSGCKLLTLSTPDGKLTPEILHDIIQRRGDVHAVQPKVISITQATECGTVYSLAEIRAICSFAHERGMFVHMDGARLANAAVFLGCSLEEMTADCGVDILSFGGTKNGLMYGEAVIIFRPELSVDFAYYRKQTTQLASKMRFIAVQFEALFCGNLWKDNARQANAMALLLADRIATIPGLAIVYPVEGNAVFVALPKNAVSPLLEDYYCYISEGDRPVARFMTSFDTNHGDVFALEAVLRRVLSFETE